MLGIGGDNSNAASGAFFEGVMTQGYASNATIASVPIEHSVRRLLGNIWRRHRSTDRVSRRRQVHRRPR